MARTIEAPMKVIGGDGAFMPDSLTYLHAINRPDLQGKFSKKKPLAYFSMELYDKDRVGIKGGGGLGVLAGDTRRVAEQLGISLVTVTAFNTEEGHQRIGPGFVQHTELQPVTPQGEGFSRLHTVNIGIKTKYEGNVTNVPLQAWEKQLGSTSVLTVTEPNFGPLYAGENNSDHRMYQEVALGFGGHQMLKQLGMEPPIMQLNEAPTVFAAIAELDDKAGEMDFSHALSEVRHRTLFTNHTLVDAVEAPFEYDQFEQFVMPNIKNEQVKDWIKGKFVDGKLKLSTIALDLSAKKNAVSILHAEKAKFPDPADPEGFAAFKPITNGISLKEWTLPSLLAHYKANGIFDEHDLVKEGYRDRVDDLDVDDLRRFKGEGRTHLNEVLAHRKDQYGEGVNISDDALIFDWKRRFANYKRPDMFFDDPERLAQILEDTNGHLVITGKAHPSDAKMIDELQRVLTVIDGNETLKQRVHYIQDYDEELGKALAIGGDIAINVPEVGLEACGTSFMKDIANGKLLISTEDGGVADVRPARYLQVDGKDRAEETESLYTKMVIGAEIARKDWMWEAVVKTQLKDYAHTISGSEMMKRYFDYLFPVEKPVEGIGQVLSRVRSNGNGHADQDAEFGGQVLQTMAEIVSQAPDFDTTKAYALWGTDSYLHGTDFPESLVFEAGDGSGSYAGAVHGQVRELEEGGKEVLAGLTVEKYRNGDGSDAMAEPSGVVDMAVRIRVGSDNSVTLLGGNARTRNLVAEEAFPDGILKRKDKFDVRGQEAIAALSQVFPLPQRV
jgi:starch phosphorylase